MFGGSPPPEQGICKGDAFAINDIEEASAEVRHEITAILADLCLERATGLELHFQNLALGRCRNPPLLEARGVRPCAPNHRPGRLMTRDIVRSRFGFTDCIIPVFPPRR